MNLYTIFRESSDPQERKKGLARQRRQINRFAETWEGGPHKIYEPHAQVIESASQGSRREWEIAVDRGIDLYHKGLVDAFAFPEVDRETRNPLISIPILRRVLDAGILVFFAEEGLLLDPDDPRSVNKYSEAVAKSCAYIDVMVQKTRGGRFDRAQEDGLLPTNRKMFGFDIVDGKRIVNQAQAAALRKAGDIILKEGRPGPAIRWLNDQGWRSVNGKPFTRSTVSTKPGGIFWNRALIGETVINFREKQVIIRHEAIFDMATLESIQRIVEGRRRDPRSLAFYALVGISICGCGAKWESNRTGNLCYYRCRARCGEKPWKKEVLEQVVWDRFGEYLRQRQSRMDYLALARQSEAKLHDELVKVEREFEGINTQWKVLLWKDLGGYPREVIEQKKKELSAATESLHWQKARIEGQLLLLPQVDPEDVERELTLLGEPWLVCDWSTPDGSPHIGLTREQAEIMRQTLLRLGANVHVKRGEIRIIGQLPLKVGAKEATSESHAFPV